jgi:hypothetical protein
MVSESIDTAMPLAVITMTLPVVGVKAVIDEIGIERVDPSLEVTVKDLLRQNFTVIGTKPKPAPVIVKVPEFVARDKVYVDSPEIVGAVVVSRETVLIPVIPIPDPAPF